MQQYSEFLCEDGFMLHPCDAITLQSPTAGEDIARLVEAIVHNNALLDPGLKYRAESDAEGGQLIGQFHAHDYNQRICVSSTVDGGPIHPGVMYSEVFIQAYIWEKEVFVNNVIYDTPYAETVVNAFTSDFRAQVGL